MSGAADSALVTDAAATLADLDQLLKVGDRPDLALNAAQNLGRLAPQLDAATATAAAEMLATSLEDSSPIVRGTVAVALGHLGEAAAPQVGDVAKLLGDPDAAVRSQAVRALGLMGARIAGGYQDSIAPLLADGDVEVKLSVAKALSNLGTLQPSAAGIASLLTHEHHYVRTAGLQAIVTLGEDAGAAALGIDKIMTNEALSATMRETAVQAMAALGKHADAYALNLALLVPLAAKDPSLPAKGILSQNQPNVRIGIAAREALKKLGDHASKAVPELIRQLQANEDEHRDLAHKTLVEMEKWESVPEKDKAAFTAWKAEKSKASKK